MMMEKSLNSTKANAGTNNWFTTGHVEMKNVSDEIESDEEFDDTRIETPRSIRNDISGHNLSSTYFPDHQQKQSLRNTAIKIPLKDPQVTENEENKKEYTRYRSTNGTPKVLSLVLNTAARENFEIRENESLSRPNILPDGQGLMRRSFTQYSSPLRKQIRRRSIIDSPPSNLKIRPLNISLPSSSKRARILDDINAGLNKFQTERLPARQTPNRYSVDSLKDSDGLKGKIDIKAPSNNVEPLPLQFPESSVQLEDDSQSNNFKNESISRANLLERVNQTLDSISNQDSPDKLHKTSEPNVHASMESSKQVNSEVAGQDHEISSSSDFDEFIEKLNFKYRETSPVLDNSTPKVNDSILKGSAINKQGRETERKTPHENNTGYDVFRNEVGSSSKFLDQLVSRNISLSTSEEWTLDKWKRLNRVVRLKSITRQEAINSQALVKAFGCKNKTELKQRIDFLISFNRLRRNPQKSHGLKSTKRSFKYDINS